MGELLTGPLVSLHPGPAPKAPPRPSRLGRNMLSTLVLAVALGWAAQVIELRPLELVRDLGNIGVFLKGYLNPSFVHIGPYAWQCVITICIALWGTVMAIVIAVPLGLLGANNLAPHPLLYHAARRIMDLFRAVNEWSVTKIRGTL
jgi:phosphonate transport system permease protein